MAFKTLHKMIFKKYLSERNVAHAMDNYNVMVKIVALVSNFTRVIPLIIDHTIGNPRNLT